ncbi:M48 family metalloprotease [Escherichia coli]|uniref:M48 family metalloprotease n=1 Tax=Escherichia coli TaxID=562 RepID=UPI002452DD83|nr:M48 family metalloprotease [Escherichia coli]
MTSLKTSIKTITYLSDIGCLEIQGASLAINAKYSRDKESEADDFSFDLLKKRGISTQGLVGSFEKLASLDGGRTQSMFDSHPPSTERAQHIRDRIASGK